jgi:hypothetical protein
MQGTWVHRALENNVRQAHEMRDHRALGDVASNIRQALRRGQPCGDVGHEEGARGAQNQDEGEAGAAAVYALG